MNRPIIRIVATDGKAYPLAQAAAPIVPANNGAAATPSHGAQHVAIPPLTAEETAKVWARVEKHGSDECWPWIGSVDRRGRGRFNLGNRKSYPAPRLLWRISRDQDPAELCVCHSCDNPNCVNPSHLWLGTHQENLDDAKRKGRMGHPLLDYCVNGHEMSGSNVGIRYDGFRKCRTCESLRRQREKDKKNLLKRVATGEAEGFSPVPSVSPTFPCRHCGGAGEAEYMGLTEDRYHWRTCHVCEGSRVEAPYCDVCGSNLTCDLYCVSCDDWASLVYVERIAPGRVAL